MKRLMLFLSIVLIVLVAGCTDTKTALSQTSTILDEQFTVPANGIKSYESDLRAGDEIQASITVLQGGNLDIDFSITNANGAKIVSRSRIGQSTVSWTVPSSGTYYFKYDNSFSLMTAKIVKTTITLTR